MLEMQFVLYLWARDYRIKIVKFDRFLLLNNGGSICLGKTFFESTVHCVEFTTQHLKEIA